MEVSANSHENFHARKFASMEVNLLPWKSVEVDFVHGILHRREVDLFLRQLVEASMDVHGSSRKFSLSVEV